MAKGNFGEHLKRERDMREVTLAELTAGTRIGPRFLTTAYGYFCPKTMV